MRKITFLLVLFIVLLNPLAHPETQNAIIKDVRGEIFEDTAQIIVEANCDIEYLDYPLQNPPQIVIDPIGKVYSDLKDVITFDQGPVKKVTVVKGKPEEGLTGNFYSLDFVSIELSNPQEYKIKREKQEIIVDIGKKKEVEVSKLIPQTEETTPEPEEESIEPLPIEETKPETPNSQLQAPISQLQTPQPTSPQPTEVIPLAEPQKEEEVEPIKLIYTIGEGDSLDISVWLHSELDKKVIVRPDGYISFPLVGDIKAKGNTPPQLASNIRENLSRLIRDPQVTVIVAGFGSKNIFVLGEVTKPGSYPYRGGISVLDAVSEAGGWKNSAVLNSVMLVRKAFTEAPEAHRLDVYALIKRGDFSQNLPLEPGDIVYVPKSFIANIGGFIENLRISIGAYVSEGTHIFD